MFIASQESLPGSWYGIERDNYGEEEYESHIKFVEQK
jgi:hypothetical protein